jgi:hypothetical protein
MPTLFSNPKGNFFSGGDQYTSPALAAATTFTNDLSPEDGHVVVLKEDFLIVQPKFTGSSGANDNTIYTFEGKVNGVWGTHVVLNVPQNDTAVVKKNYLIDVRGISELRIASIRNNDAGSTISDINVGWEMKREE